MYDMYAEAQGGDRTETVYSDSEYGASTGDFYDMESVTVSEQTESDVVSETEMTFRRIVFGLGECKVVPGRVATA